MRMAEDRAYDRGLRERGASLAYRIDEPVPTCWVCATTTAPRSNEHTFPRWLLERLDASGQHIEMAHMSAIGLEMSRRGPIPLGNMVNGQICQPCNNGWMAELELDFKRIYEMPRIRCLSPDEAKVMARWFAKTAIVLNTS
jgi:hypothetical protein